ncbi:Hypothetical_protein [Hexamita inflata]|uniref:Hypothetical_protein n=1 Tax=Hexamita inflata TaxID=28002 RepID=A0AA86QEV9_9EUKA|nr:Hypothetical protein HINF_LOCUS45636 [Hexamita inflata]
MDQRTFLLNYKRRDSSKYFQNNIDEKQNIQRMLPFQVVFLIQSKVFQIKLFSFYFYFIKRVKTQTLKVKFIAIQTKRPRSAYTVDLSNIQTHKELLHDTAQRHRRTPQLQCYIIKATCVAVNIL